MEKLLTVRSTSTRSMAALPMSAKREMAVNVPLSSMLVVTNSASSPP